MSKSTPAYLQGSSAAKLAFAVTDKGHAYDAALAKIRQDALEQEAALAAAHKGLGVYDDEGKNPVEIPSLLRFGLGGDNYGLEGRPDLAARHQAYTAKAHAEGRNAWNPFGGWATPLESEGSRGKPGLFGAMGQIDLKPEYAKYLKKESAAVRVPGAQGVFSRIGELLGGGKKMTFSTREAVIPARDAAGNVVMQKGAPKMVSGGQMPPMFSMEGTVNPAYTQAASDIAKANKIKLKDLKMRDTAYKNQAPGMAGLRASDPAARAEAQKVLAARVGAGALGAGALYGGYKMLSPDQTRTAAEGSAEEPMIGPGLGAVGGTIGGLALNRILGIQGMRVPMLGGMTGAYLGSRNVIPDDANPALGAATGSGVGGLGGGLAGALAGGLAGHHMIPRDPRHGLPIGAITGAALGILPGVLAGSGLGARAGYELMKRDQG
jgi:hypothetical protein